MAEKHEGFEAQSNITLATGVTLEALTKAVIAELANMGATTISAAQWGYCGALTTHPLGGDGTAGRILRNIWLIIDNGTNGISLKCTVSSQWNGDVIAETDDIVKDATTGHFTVNAAGDYLAIENAGLSGNVKAALGTLNTNLSTVSVFVGLYAYTNDIVLRLKLNATGVAQDITTLVDTGVIILDIFYVTDA